MLPRARRLIARLRGKSAGTSVPRPLAPASSGGSVRPLRLEPVALEPSPRGSRAQPSSFQRWVTPQNPAWGTLLKPTSSVFAAGIVAGAVLPTVAARLVSGLVGANLVRRERSQTHTHAIEICRIRVRGTDVGASRRLLESVLKGVLT